LFSAFFFASCWAWSEADPHPATNPTSTSKASTHTNDRTFVISRIVLSFVSRPSWPFLLYGPTISTTSSARSLHRQVFSRGPDLRL
jgi:hypothetical protein